LESLKKKFLKTVQSNKFYKAGGQTGLILKALKVAEKAHSVQKRASGEPYIIHPINVALILVDLQADCKTICAGLLHDVLEDTEISEQDLLQEFGLEITNLVKGVTKLHKLELVSEEDEQSENFRKMLLAIAKDFRVVLVKLADRLHNMRTLGFLAPEKIKRISTETLKVFAPLANRFGLWHIKWQLEDLAFKHSLPREYQKVKDLIYKNRKKREKSLEKISIKVREKLDKYNLKAKVLGRIKHFYSVYNKIQRNNHQSIFDLTAIRIIVSEIKDCYETLGIMHDLFQPIPGKFKDYIAIPKSNMYQSLHTVAITDEAEIVEIQIRTEAMNEIAEYGIAAHWKYKETGRSIKALSEHDRKLSLLRNKIVEMQEDLPDPRNYNKAIEIDLFTDEIFVLSPRGDVYSLPRGASPVDFAYYVHTEIGNNCVGAKINGKIVRLDYEIKTGDIVDIQTRKNSSPSQDWLSFVKSGSAKTKIRQWFRKNRRDFYFISGEKILIEALGKTLFDELKKKKSFDLIAQKANFSNQENLFINLGSGDFSLNQVLGRLKNYDLLPEEKYQSDHSHIPRTETPKQTKLENQLEKIKNKARKTKSQKKNTPKNLYNQIKELKNISYVFAKCCGPLPGQEIEGLVSRSRGVIVHKKNCPSLKNANPKRLIQISWDDHIDLKKRSFSITLEIECIDRLGVSRDIFDKIANSKINIVDVRLVTRPTQQTALLRVSVEIYSQEDLQNLINSLRSLPNITNVYRVFPKKNKSEV